MQRSPSNFIQEFSLSRPAAAELMLRWPVASAPEIFPSARERLVMHYLTELLLFDLGFKRGPVFYYVLDEVHSEQQESKFESIEDTNLLPFGVSGFGYVGNTQYYNHCDLDAYLSAVEGGRVPVWVGADLDLDERRRRAVMFGLRSHGVNRTRYQDRGIPLRTVSP